MAALMLAAMFVAGLVPVAASGLVGFLGHLFVGISALVALIVLIPVALVRSWPHRADRALALHIAVGAPAVAALTLALLLPSFWLGGVAFRFGLVTIGRPWLGARIEEARGLRGAGRTATIASRPFRTEVDFGPPVRVAFVTDPGLLDNWSAVVFDPTGRVELARGWDAKGRWLGPPDVTALFGGDLVDCERLVRPYYFCTFT